MTTEATDLRALPITSGSNFRELGGYQTKDGRYIKFHKILRSGMLATLNQQDLAYLNDYGMRAVVDFRSDDEVKHSPDKLPDNATYHYLPVFDYDQTENSESLQQLEARYRHNPNLGHQKMLRVYHNMIADPHAKQSYRQFFETLLANTAENQAVLFHCTAGKDRTGMAAVFFLTALGVDPQTIKQDYLLTNRIAAPIINARLDELAAHHATNDTIANIRALLSVNPEYLATAIKQIKKEAGSIINYLHQGLQLTDDDIKTLRQLYLTK